MSLTDEQRTWLRQELERARVEGCWCIVHNPETDEHNSMPRTAGGVS